MKQLPKTFVVEHKRRTRKGTETPSIWSGTTGRELHDLLQADVKAQAAADLEVHDTSETSIAVDTACLAPKGRILEAKVEPIASGKLEASAAAEPPRRRGRPHRVIVQALTLAIDDAPATDLEGRAP